VLFLALVSSRVGTHISFVWLVLERSMPSQFLRELTVSIV